MNVNILIFFVSVAIFLFFIFSIPMRRKSLFLRAGKCLLSLPSPSLKKIVGIFVVCALIIALLPLQRFALYIQIILALSCILGAHFASREAISFSRFGIYENAIILGNDTIFYDEINLFPTLAYENDAETTSVDKSSLQIILKNGQKKELAFENEEVRKNVLDVILSIRPEFKAK